MSFRKSIIMVFLAILACSLLLAGPVFATVSEHYYFAVLKGYSKVPEGHYVNICDTDLDGINMWAHYNATGGTGWVEDIDGFGGSCNSTNWKSVVNWHEACWDGWCKDRSYH